jgi:hypothetical protein
VDHDVLRKYMDDIRLELEAGREVRKGNTSIEPMVEGGGYLLTSRGQHWHFHDVYAALRAYVTEISRI